MIKNILHLCADIGSDSYPYQLNQEYNVIKIGIEIGVENYTTNIKIHGIIANPVCKDFSTAMGFHKKKIPDLTMLKNCQRIIKDTNPEWYIIENPYNGTMKNYLGIPDFIYQPWEYGSPWTKKTALWGNFNKPEKVYKKWELVPKNKSLYIRPGRPKPSLAFLHKSAIHNINEFKPFINYIKNDADFRSLCSQKFAKAFFDENK